MKRNKELKVLVYEKSTGEIRPDCPLCGIYVFADEQSRNFHMHRANLADRASLELTDQEFDELPGDFDTKKNRFKCKVNTKKAKYSVKERKEQEVDIHLYGITYKDKRPEKVLSVRGSLKKRKKGD